MPEYRLHLVPQDGQPKVLTIEAKSMEEAMSLSHAKGLAIEAIEAVDLPEQLEPAGPIPASAPRQLPSGVFGAAEGPGMMMFGAMFTIIPVIFIIVGVGIVASGDLGGLFFALFPLIHLSIGVLTIYNVVSTRRRRVKLYANGVAATAKIDRSRKTKTRINNRRLNEFEWTFYVHDQPFHGKRRSLNPKALDFVEGQRIWVLYDPADPTDSVEW